MGGNPRIYQITTAAPAEGIEGIEGIQGIEGIEGIECIGMCPDFTCCAVPRHACTGGGILVFG